MAALRCLFNDVTITITGDCHERFINLCRNKGVELHDIRVCDGYVCCIIPRRQFAALRGICRTTGCRVKIIKKRGIRYILFKYRKHYSFAIGILIAACILKYINLFVWDITIDGNGIYSDAYITNYLRSLNIENGMHISDVDVNRLEKKIRQDFDEVTWVSVQIKGTRIAIALKENDGAALTNTADEYSDIYADSDGVIESIVTRSGTALVKAGDTVSRGDVLVSGRVVITDAYGEELATIDKQADADIYIRTDTAYYDCVYRSHREKSYTGREKTTFLIEAFGKEISILPGSCDDNWDMWSEKVNLSLFGKINLPFGINVVKYNEYVYEDISYTDDQMRLVLAERFDRYIKNLQNSVQILSNDVKISEKDGYFTMEGGICVIAPSVQYGVYSGNEDMDERY